MTTVLFDIDGTLISTGGAGRIAFAHTFRELFDIHEIAANVGFAGRSDRAIAFELMEVHGIEPSVENWHRFTAAFLPHLERVLPQSPGKILPGVIELLDQLAVVDQATIGLLTGNIALGAKAKLTHYQLLDRFNFGGYGDDWTDRCDIAVAALKAAQAHQNGKSAASGKVIVIGDTPADITCARAIDAYAVAVATGGATYEELQRAEPDLLVRDLTDTGKLLRAVHGAAAA
jgi:phosphoglycolate phosphatase-like HAD superfamily hydrolase